MVTRTPSEDRGRNGHALLHEHEEGKTDKSHPSSKYRDIS